MRQKTVYILRGVSGSGKSTLAESLIVGRSGIICTADDFFMVDGEYKFNPAKLGKAHQECQVKFLGALVSHEYDVIVVANTNTSAKEYNEYLVQMQMHKEYVDKVHYLVIENRHGNKDVHGVPDEIRRAQADRIRNSLQLL